jgi:hypothetical protein
MFFEKLNEKILNLPIISEGLSRSDNQTAYGAYSSVKELSIENGLSQI